MRPKLLDLFCGVGGCSVGYHRAGFDVVGVDHEPQPNYPYDFVKGDAILTMAHLLDSGFIYPQGMPLRLEDFSAIHASPPCQGYSIARHIHQSGRRHPDLVDPVRRLLIKGGRPWIIENVIGSPLQSAVMLCGLMFGLKVLRHRVFECSDLLFVPPHPKHPAGNLTTSNKGYSTGANGFVCVAGHNFVRAAGASAMGIDWAKTRHELAQAIPPAYTEHLGRQLIQRLAIAA